MSYEDVSDFGINKMVADALGIKTVRYSHAADKRSVGVKNSEVHFEWFDYCNNPSDAWPIIFENKISITGLNPARSRGWEADAVCKMGLGCPTVEHENPLRAAMIVFLMMQEQDK